MFFLYCFFRKGFCVTDVFVMFLVPLILRIDLASQNQSRTQALLHPLRKVGKQQGFFAFGSIEYWFRSTIDQNTYVKLIYICLNYKASSTSHAIQHF
jgi:hypothetical protein